VLKPTFAASVDFPAQLGFEAAREFHGRCPIHHDGRYSFGSEYRPGRSRAFGRLMRLDTTHNRCSACCSSDAAQGGEGGVVGAIECVQVLLGSGDGAVAEAFFNGLEVGAAGEEPGGVGVA
jgi:hypothetical protein